MIQKPRTVRISVRLTPDALTWIENEADRYGVTTTEVVRRIVDDTRGARIGQPKEPAREAIR